MAQLDRLITAMTSAGADSVVLAEGDAATLVTGAARRPVTRQSLTAAQLLGFVREIAPADAAALLDAERSAHFTYTTAEGAFQVRATHDGARWTATLSAANGTSAVAIEPAIVAATSPAAAAAPVPTIRVSEAGQGTTAIIDALLRELVERGGSDLHLRCGEPPVLRTSGELVRLEQPPVHAAVLDAMLLSIMPERNRAEYAASNDTDFAYEIDGLARFRANALRDRRGPAAVFRVIPATVVSVEEMKVSEEVQKLCQLTKGLVLVTGPTGSGKSTTLCALVDLVNRTRGDHILTIEDPIEFVHPNKRCLVTQRQVGVHTSTFKSALRAALREDPDVILVGELRDLETTAIAIETAETGHLVFATLHTTTAPGTVDRIIDQFPADRQSQIRVMLSESLKGVISQVLCRKIGGGRVAAREILLSMPAVSNLIREGKTYQIPTVMQTSRRLGMLTLNDALIELVDGCEVEPKEAYTKAVDKPSMLTLLRTRGHDTSFAETAAAAAANAR
jgi:twitching motility protein PilT